jgi:inhibitor of KinA
MSDFGIQVMGDSCLSVVFEEKIDLVINARCVALAGALERADIPGLRDVVPTYHTVAVHFDPRRIDRARLQADLNRLSAAATSAQEPEPRTIEIPVRYGGESGPDLASVAMFGGCSEEEVVRLHAGVVYRVYMLGFLPGFAYLGVVDRRIAMPRLESPRVRVPGGSVGIAGVQTGVYPCDSPGGWRIIGRTAMKLFDPDGVEPLSLGAGDRVKFMAA